jgi:hypothetical protein
VADAATLIDFVRTQNIGAVVGSMPAIMDPPSPIRARRGLRIREQQPARMPAPTEPPRDDFLRRQ